jgi:RNA polymerase sigma-70 factor (ECF subfamily)
VNDPDQLDELLVRERRRRVVEALGGLSPRLREVILLRFEQGLDYADIAAIVGRPQATIRTRIFHGLKKLREHIAEAP